MPFYDPKQNLLPQTAKERYQALGRLKKGGMNKTEQKFAQRLEYLKGIGDILWYRWDSVNLRLADNCFYKTDFFAMNKDNELICYEVKGFMTDDALVKLKVAADSYPFRFFVCKWVKSEWDIKEI